jgi:hypothetical protein
MSNGNANGCGVCAAPPEETAASMSNWFPVLLTKLPSASITPLRSSRTRGAGPDGSVKCETRPWRLGTERSVSVVAGRFPTATLPESKLSFEVLPMGTIKSPPTPVAEDSGDSNARRKTLGVAPPRAGRAVARAITATMLKSLTQNSRLPLCISINSLHYTSQPLQSEPLFSASNPEPIASTAAAFTLIVNRQRFKVPAYR